MDPAVDRLHHLSTAEQLAAVTAVRALDPDAIVALDDETLRGLLGALSDPQLTAKLDPEAREAASRYLDSIM